MSYFAKLENSIVTKVIVAEVEFFETFVDDIPGQWIETKMDGSIRKNYAGIGFTYDATRDAFIPVKPSSRTFILPLKKWYKYLEYLDDNK